MDVEGLGSFQMSNVLMFPLKNIAAKRTFLKAKELRVKGIRCLVIDPDMAEK